MMRTVAPCLALACLAALSAGTAYGQATYRPTNIGPGGYTSPYVRPNWRPGYQPQLSPYLNMLRGGDPAANYYLGVRPERQRRQFQRDASTELDALESQPRAGGLSREDQDLLETELTTGHPATSNSTLGYFNNTAGFYPQTPQAGSRPGPPPLRPRGVR